MASEAADEQGKLNSTANLLERSQTGSSVWNLCSIPSDSQAVDLRDITPSLSPVFTEDQVRELSGQTGDLDGLGDHFLPHDTFKRIAEVLSPEQTNLLINTCTSLCSSGVTPSYSDPLVGSLGHYSSQHDLNTPPGNFQVMDAPSANSNEKENTDHSKHLPKLSALSSSTGEDNIDQDCSDVNTESEEKVNEDSTKQSDPELKNDSELKKAKGSKTKNVKSSYSLRSSPRKPSKEQDAKTTAGNSAQNTKQKDKKETVADTSPRRSLRGQKQPEKVEETVTDKNTKSRRGQRKDEVELAKEEGDKSEAMSLRRSSRIQKCDTSPVNPKTQSPKKGRGAKKKAAPEEDEVIKTEDHLIETTPENDKHPADTQTNKDSTTEKEESEQELPEVKDETKNSSKNETDVCSEEQITDITKAEVSVTTPCIPEPKTDQEPVLSEPNFIEKDLLATVNPNQIPTGEETVDTTFISTIEGTGNRDFHILSTGEGIVGRDLLPTGGGIVDRVVMGTDVKDLLTVEKDLFEIIEKEIYKPRNESLDFDEENIKMGKEDDIPKSGESSLEEATNPIKRKSGNKKDLQPSRRSNRISESIQKKEIEAAVKKAQEEMFREREEQERLEREEEERKQKEEEEKKKMEEDLKRKEEQVIETIVEKEPDENEMKEKEMEKKNVIKKKERNQENSKDEAKKNKNDAEKKESKSELKAKETHNKTPDNISHSKIRNTSTDKPEEKKSSKPADSSDKNTLFAVGGDHEVYSTVKHKRHPSESEKTTNLDLDKHGHSPSSDDERNSHEEPLDEDDSDYDPEYDPERLWCICRKPHGNRFMICCDTCEEWLHGDCVSITKEIGKEMEKNGIEYICPRCVIAKRRLKEQGIDPNKEKQTDESSSVKKRRRRRRLKIPGEKHHKHSLDSRTRQHKQERHERKSKDESQRDHRDSKRKSIDPGAFYKIPKKVRTTPTPASFSSRTQRKCINSDCPNHAETNSVYCSDACVSRHAKESIALLQDERRKRIGSTPNKPTTPPSPINVPMPWDSPHSTASPSQQVKERVAVMERSTGRVIAGVAAPAEHDLVHWLQRHPTFEVIKPTVSKEVKKKDKREEERAIRDNVKRSLKEILSSRLKEAPELKLSPEDISKFAINIEEDLYKLFGDAGPRYKSKYRSLAFNLKDFRNKVLFQHVLNGEVPSDKLVGMTAEQLASQELARWRERETKHTLEMIKLNQLDINVSKGHVKKTHKGEIELDEDEDLSNLELRTKENPQVAEPDSNTSPGPLLIDTTDQHRIHLFDLNCLICTGKMQPPGEPPRQEDMLMLVSTSTPIQALAESSVPSPPPINMDIPSVSSTESFDVASMSPPAPIKPVKRDKPVWKGYIMMQSVSKFSTNAYRVSGPCDDLLQMLPDTLHLQGRIGFGQVWDYIYQLRHSTSRDVSIIRYEVTSDDEKTSYVSLYSYFYSRKRCGVISNCYPGVKDMYIMPLASHSPVPAELLPFDGPGLEEPRPHMLLGIIVRNRSNFKRPRPVTQPHRSSSSPTSKRRHSSSRSSEESQHKDSPPREIEDIVFQYNKRPSVEAKPSLSPSSGSSDHSSALGSPSVGAALSLVTDKSGDDKIGNTQKTKEEELQDLADRAKQYIATALQSKKQVGPTAVETTDEKKSDDSDKPYDPEEYFDLDVELEKPIDEKKKAAASTKAPIKSSDVSSTEVVSSCEDMDKTKTDRSDTTITVIANTGEGASSASKIPLLGTVSSSTPTTSTIPAIPSSIFMPITTSSVTSTSQPTQSTSLPIPSSSDLAGIVKLLGASLKQVTSAGQSSIQGQTDTPKASTISNPTTSTSTVIRPTDSFHAPQSSTTTEKQSYKSVSEGSRRHEEHTSETDRQRIDRERLEWRERRVSREEPRGHADNVPHDDRWRESHAPPMRRASDDRHHGDSYGPHRGSHGDRGRYHPYHHRVDHRGDRRDDRPRDDPRWRERWRR